VEKNKKFTEINSVQSSQSDTATVEPPQQIVLDNPNAYEYRLDPDQIRMIYPEIVFKVDDKYVIDYYSLFPIIIELLNKQQILIEDLQLQIDNLKQSE
jgi:hypothetical protein